jgi:hypothetical protein
LTGERSPPARRRALRAIEDHPRWRSASRVDGAALGTAHSERYEDCGEIPGRVVDLDARWRERIIVARPVRRVLQRDERSRRRQ